MMTRYVLFIVFLAYSPGMRHWSQKLIFRGLLSTVSSGVTAVSNIAQLVNKRNNCIAAVAPFSLFIDYTKKAT
jgi:hypothetical protein